MQEARRQAASPDCTMSKFGIAYGMLSSADVEVDHSEETRI